MELLGARIRHRRRQLKLRQSDVSGSNSASFLSKVENGSADPSLNSLRDWSEKLGVPAAELLGDHLLLEAAKHSILHPEICNRYLDKLKATPATCFLKKLSASAAALSIAVPEPPADPELQFLTAQVLRRRGMLQEAGELAERAIAYTYSPLLRISYLSLLCQIYGELDEAAKQKEVKEKLSLALVDLDHNTLLQNLPDPEAISTEDLALVTLSALIQTINLL